MAWLNKKVATTVKKIDLSARESLAGIEKESIVFHGDLSSNEHRVMFEQLALADDYNGTSHLIKITTTSKLLIYLMEQYKFSGPLVSQLVH